MRFLELEWDSVDAKDGNLLRVATILPDIVLYIKHVSPFHLQLQTEVAEVRYDLFYQYQLSRRIGGPILRSGERRSMARDVCSETQHRSSRSRARGSQEKSGRRSRSSRWPNCCAS